MGETTLPRQSSRRRPLAAVLEFAWRRFCDVVVNVHYRRCEVDGLEHIPRSGPVVLCANHPSALIDALILQSALPRMIHPLARSGLFRNPLIRPMLAVTRAVPVYRRQDAEGNPVTNEDMFRKCYELLDEGGVILIFPEGVSHNDPQMRQLKTGAARLVLGAIEHGVKNLTVLPVGLNFSEIGRFRNSVFIKIEAPLPLDMGSGADESAVRHFTDRILDALKNATLNLESWADLDMMRRLERFFALRRGKYRKRSLSQRFRALQKFSTALQQLREKNPETVEWADRSLRQFERLCGRFGVRDYQLAVKNTPLVVARFVIRSLFMLVFGIPFAMWGAANSIVPYALTGLFAVRFSNDRYQFDTAKISFGMLFFGLFWSVQTALVYYFFGIAAAAGYALTLLPTGALALIVRRERTRIVDNTKVFFLFLRKKKIKEILKLKRAELEKNLAGMAKLAKRGI